MKLYSKLVLLCVLCAFSAFGLPSDTFAGLLKRAGITYTQPEGWVETPVVDNNQMHYNFALKYPGKNIEVRYTIRPMDSLLVQYQRMNKRPGSVMLHPNSYFKPSFMATMMNISDHVKTPMVKSFDSLAVRRDFDADKGMMGLVIAGKTFAQDYQYCDAFAIQKDNVGYAYCFILFNDQADFKQFAPVVFKSLRFNP